MEEFITILAAVGVLGGMALAVENLRARLVADCSSRIDALESTLVSKKRESEARLREIEHPSRAACREVAERRAQMQAKIAAAKQPMPLTPEQEARRELEAYLAQ